MLIAGARGLTDFSAGAEHGAMARLCQVVQIKWIKAIMVIVFDFFQ